MSEPIWRRPVYVLFCAVAIILIATGIRQSFGLFVKPITIEMGWGFGVFSSAIAIQNLMIGLAAPIVGSIADRWGPVRVIVMAAILYIAGLALMSQSVTPLEMRLSAGLLIGLGVSGCGLPLLLATVGRAAPEGKRSLWLGIVTAGATAGQMLVVPLSQFLIDTHGWVTTVLVLAAAAALIVPLAASMARGGIAEIDRKTRQRLGEALREARGHRGYILLVVGFYVCGLQVQFIAVHLPNFLEDSGLGAALAATAIAVIGLFNMFGTYTAGYLGGKLRKTYLLSLIYVSRSVVILAFTQLPVSETSVLLFAAAIGFLWLSTVPLTSGIVAAVFGTRYMATLFGIVFLSHQLGSFTGVWLGGVIRDATGSYDAFWWVMIVLGLVAALIHLPIDDRPLARVSESA